MSRSAFSASILDLLVEGTPFTRDVPLGFQSRTLPGVTPAHEYGTSGKGTGKGRGAPVLDVYSDSYEIAPGIVGEASAGFKIGKTAKLPTAPVVTTGNPSHVDAVIEAAKSGTPLAMIFAITMVIAGIVGFGTNRSTAERAAERRDEAERLRSQLIDRLRLEEVGRQ